MTMPPPPPGGFPEDPNQSYGQPAGGYGQPAAGQPAGGYGQPPAYGDPNQYGGSGGSPSKNNLGGIALGLGIASVVCCIIGPLLGIPAIILGRMSQQAAEQGLATNGGMGKTGFILGIVGTGLCVFAWILNVIGTISLNSLS
ncbi:MAG: DUF4190 domain-containing protein [Micrococcales bacterium]|nr:DUF4190 domain-containing protein [Micrococcales bacterium]